MSQVEDIIKRESDLLFDSLKVLPEIRKEVVKLYLSNPKAGILTKYIDGIMGTDWGHGAYSEYMTKRKKLRKSGHMGQGAGFYLEEIVYDIIKEIVARKHGNKYSINSQMYVVGNGNRKQDIVICDNNNKAIIVIELKAFMSDEYCRKMVNDKKDIDAEGCRYFGYAPFIFEGEFPKKKGTSNKMTRAENEKQDKRWLFCGDFEPFIDAIDDVLR